MKRAQNLFFLGGSKKIGREEGEGGVSVTNLEEADGSKVKNDGFCWVGSVSVDARDGDIEASVCDGVCLDKVLAARTC